MALPLPLSPLPEPAPRLAALLIPPPLPRLSAQNRDVAPLGVPVPAMTPAKRALDIALSAALLVLLAPLVALIVLAIRIESRGPAFFVQERVGYRGVRFPMLKFRSMRSGSEALRAVTSSDRAGICFKAIRDPRVTRVGRVLRKTSLDELPQLWNVLRGEMSLVGPRPALPREVAAYPEAALRRLNSVPGLTGLWQVSGRADLDFETMIALDLRYQATRSFRTDLALLWRTVGAVVTARGAY